MSKNTGQIFFGLCPFIKILGALTHRHTSMDDPVLKFLNLDAIPRVLPEYDAYTESSVQPPEESLVSRSKELAGWLLVIMTGGFFPFTQEQVRHCIYYMINLLRIIDPINAQGYTVRFCTGPYKLPMWLQALAPDHKHLTGDAIIFNFFYALTRLGKLLAANRQHEKRLIAIDLVIWMCTRMDSYVPMVCTGEERQYDREAWRVWQMCASKWLTVAKPGLAQILVREGYCRKEAQK